MLEVPMHISECMTTDVRVVSPQDSIQSAAWIMGEIDAGILPVSQDNKLVGLITDRDITVRAVANGLGFETPVEEVMTREVKYCFQDEEIDEVLDNMGHIQLRRLPVVDRDKRLVGIISLSDLALDDSNHAGEALTDITRPSSLHSQHV
jgi:CBS domain-containing protein